LVTVNHHKTKNISYFAKENVLLYLVRLGRKRIGKLLGNITSITCTFQTANNVRIELEASFYLTHLLVLSYYLSRQHLVDGSEQISF